MRGEHVDVVSLHTYIHTYIGTANSPYVTLVFGARSGSPRINRAYSGVVVYSCWCLHLNLRMFSSGGGLAAAEMVESMIVC